MSQFLSDSSDYNVERGSDIDFSSAVRLPQQGSACEVYKTRWQRRTVLVKRLKEEFRDIPLNLDALEKEYEIGVNLNHPSLPTYLAFYRDYIVMEYIDGETLSSMLKEEDPWLRNGKNQLSLLKNLAEVMDYLHRHKVVHCDIKPDNIILTANGYNPVLVDLDKCYTDAFSDTSGHPDKFGLPVDNPGRVAMDFRGLANVAESISAKYPTSASKKIKRFIDSARKEDVTVEALKESLEDKRKFGVLSFSFLALGMIVVAAAIGGGNLFFKEREKGIDVDSEVRMQAQVVKDTVTPSPSHSALASAPSYIAEEAVSGVVPEVNKIKAQEKLHQEARARAGVLDKLIAPRYSVLNARLDCLILLKSSEISGEQLLDSIRAFADFEEECFQEMGAIMKETFPSMSAREESRVLAYSKVYTGYNRRSVAELTELNRILLEKMGF